LECSPRWLFRRWPVGLDRPGAGGEAVGTIRDGAVDLAAVADGVHPIHSPVAVVISAVAGHQGDGRKLSAVSYQRSAHRTRTKD
jgi:hypothetical protein